MTTDQLIAVLALIVAIVGPITTWLVAKGRNDAEATQAATARRQERRAKVYVDVLEHSGLILATVERTQPLWTYEGAPGPPPFPPEGEVRSLNARITAFGSREVLAALEAINKGANEFMVVASELETSERYAKPSRPLADIRKDLDEKRGELRRLIVALGERVNRELEEG